MSRAWHSTARLGSGMPACPQARERLAAGLQTAQPPIEASFPAVAIGAYRPQSGCRSPSPSRSPRAPRRGCGQRSGAGPGSRSGCPRVLGGRRGRARLPQPLPRSGRGQACPLPGLGLPGAAPTGPGRRADRGSVPNPGPGSPLLLAPGTIAPERPVSPSCCSRHSADKMVAGRNAANQREQSRNEAGGRGGDTRAAGTPGLRGHPGCGDTDPAAPSPPPAGVLHPGKGVRCQAPAGTRAEPPG